jgi:hypothetical protein
VLCLLGRHRTCTKLPCSAFSIPLKDKSLIGHDPRLWATFRMSSDETLRVLRYARYPYIIVSRHERLCRPAARFGTGVTGELFLEPRTYT